MRISLAPDRDWRARYARVAGLSYLIIVVAGIYAEFFVRSSLIVPGDAAATAGNIVRSERLFRSGLATEFVMLVCDVLIAVTLDVVFEPVHCSLSLVAAFLRVAHVAVGVLLRIISPNVRLIAQSVDSMDFRSVRGGGYQLAVRSGSDELWLFPMSVR